MSLQLPEYTTFHKFLLVEELALCSSPLRVHYGKCSLLGYLLRPDSLGSLTIPNIEEQYQVPDCSFNVRLKTDFYPVEFLNSTVEIFGEVRLYDVSSGPDSLLESSHSLVTKLRALDESRRPLGDGSNELNRSNQVRCQLQQAVEDFKHRYKALVVVDSMRHVSDARDIIAKNLQFRIIQSRRLKTLKRQN